MMKHGSNHSNSLGRRSFVIAFSVLLLVILLAWSAPRTRADSEARAYLPAVMQQLTNYTEVPTSTAVTTAIATATTMAAATATTAAAATATATPTATATGTPVMSCSNRYPITLASSLLDMNDFKPPSDPAELPYFGLYSDATYTNKTQRRIYLKDIGSAGFAFVRWRVDTPDSVSALVASLSGAGNIAQGFQEAPWPSVTALGSSPTGYPINPGQLNATDGDWIYRSNASISNDVLVALQYHVDNKTLMTLPINDEIAGAGSNATYHVQRLGDFLLRGYGSQAGAGWYLDLVYIGNSGSSQCR